VVGEAVGAIARMRACVHMCVCACVCAGVTATACGRARVCGYARLYSVVMSQIELDRLSGEESSDYYL